MNANTENTGGLGVTGGVAGISSQRLLTQQAFDTGLSAQRQVEDMGKQLALDGFSRFLTDLQISEVISNLTDKEMKRDLSNEMAKTKDYYDTFDQQASY